jgi:hypothetical protein
MQQRTFFFSFVIYKRKILMPNIRHTVWICTAKEEVDRLRAVIAKGVWYVNERGLATSFTG